MERAIVGEWLERCPDCGGAGMEPIPTTIMSASPPREADRPGGWRCAACRLVLIASRPWWPVDSEAVDG